VYFEEDLFDMETGMQTSFKVSDSLYLVRQELSKTAPAKPAEIPTNHIAVIDCSGSISYELPRIREQLKKRLPKLLKEKDTISIVWFSGKGQFGTLLEAEPVATLADLKDVNSAIDRWLKPVCLTGFKEPLEEAGKLVERVAKKLPGTGFSLFFMSDGCDNQWSRPDILKAVEKTAGGLSSATFVEYGYYADRPLLTAMAEKAGGSLIFSEGFDKYEPIFEAAMQKQQLGGKRVEVPIKGDPIGGFAWAEDSGDLITFGLSDGKIAVPEAANTIYYLSPTAVGKTVEAYEIGSAYAAISLFSVRMMPDVVLPFLKLTGDVAFIEKFGGLFGKQKYSEFMDAAKSAVFDEKQRLTKGFDPNKIPKDDAFTVLDMLALLSEDDENRVLLDHPSFKYDRISRSRVDSSTILTVEEQAEVDKLTDEMKKTKDAKKVAGFAARIAAISNKPAPLKFVADPAPDGYSIGNLVFNEEFPNVSLQVRREGSVDLTPRLPGNLTKLPVKFPTFVYRNYAVVKDGLVNVDVMPVKLSAKTLEKLFDIHKKGLVGDDVIKSDGGVTLISFRSLPVINRKMVKSVSAKILFQNEWELTKVQAQQKVYNSVLKEIVGTKKSPGFIEQYGQEAADWLKEQGFTDYSGFGPKSVQAEARDFYMAKQMTVGLKGFSSLPSLKEAREKLAKGKPNGPVVLMGRTIIEVDNFVASSAYTSATDKIKALEDWLRPLQKAADRERRGMISEKAKQIFSVIVGQVWFTEFKSLDENTLLVDMDDGQSIEGKVEQKEKKIEI
jgi:hypothetical protein